MLDRIPYTYLIGWSKLNTYYYGIRYAKNCNPNDLWNPYKTSSKYVKKYIEDNGEPDIIQIRKIFTDVKIAQNWEHKVLKRLRVVYRQDFLNKTDNKSIDIDYAKIGSTKSNTNQSVERRSKVSKANTGVPKSVEHKKKLSIARTGISNHVWKGKSAREIYPDDIAYDAFIARSRAGALTQTINPFLGKHHTESSKNKQKIKMLKFYYVDDYIIIGTQGIHQIRKHYGISMLKFKEIYQNAIVKYEDLPIDDIQLIMNALEIKTLVIVKNHKN